MFRCESCGRLVDEPILEKTESMFLYHWKCPHCGGDELIEMEQCPRCGRYHEFLYGSLGREICEDCLEEEIENIQTVIDYGSEYTEEIDINGLFMKAFYPEEINEILLKAFNKLPEEQRKKAAHEFVHDDENNFAEYVS